MPASSAPLRTRVLLHALTMAAIALLSAGCEREELQPERPDLIPPLQPADLRVDAARDGYVLLSWLRNGEPDLEGYVVWRSEQADSAAFAAVDTVVRNWVVDVGRSYDSTCFYRITALDRSGNQSEPSRVVRVDGAPNLAPPGAPGTLHAAGWNDGSDAGIRVTWTPVDEADLAGYRVYRAREAVPRAEPAFLLAGTDAPRFDDRDSLEIGVTYGYLVTAVDRGGLESLRPPAVADRVTGVPLPGSPADNALLPQFSVFRWSAADGAAAYRLLIFTGDGTEVVWSADIQDDGRATYALQYTGPVLRTGRLYAWRVAALSQPDGDANGLSELRRFQVVP